jgi:hypothetical protein
VRKLIVAKMTVAVDIGGFQNLLRGRSTWRAKREKRAIAKKKSLSGYRDQSPFHKTTGCGSRLLL